MNDTKWQTGLPHEGAKGKCIVFVTFLVQCCLVDTDLGSAHNYEPKPLRWSGREYSPHPPYPPALVDMSLRIINTGGCVLTLEG